MNPEAGQLRIEDIEAEQDIVIAECVELYNRTDLSREEKWNGCEALMAEHLGRVREICTRRLERELIDRTGSCPDYLAGDDAG